MCGLSLCVLRMKALLILCAVLLPISAFGQFVLRGQSVKISEKCFKITANEYNQRGAVWSQDKIDLTQPLELEFTIYLGDVDAEGADGIAFVLHNDPRGFNAKGTPGGGLGFGYEPFFSSSDPKAVLDAIVPSVGIEFDTYNNVQLDSDIADDHTTVVYNGDISHPQFPAVRINPDAPNVEDNQCYVYKIKWDPVKQQLELYFNGKLRFSHQDNIIDKVFDGNPIVYYGFTGATGGNKNEHTVCVYEVGSMPVAQDDVVETEPAKPVTIAVLENDTHTTGDRIALTGIVNQPENGRADLLNGKVIYTPNEGFIGTDFFFYEVCELGGSDKCYSTCATAKVTINVKCKVLQKPVISVNGATAVSELIPLCKGGASIRLSVAQTAGLSYQWKKDGNIIGGNQAVLVVNTPGTYSVTVSNICESIISSLLTVVETLAPAAPVVQDVARCGPGKVTLAAQQVESGNYRWYQSISASEPLAGGDSYYYTTPDLSTTTVYFVSYFDGSCESERVAVRAIIYELPEVYAGDNVSVVRGYQVQLQGSGQGIHYSWSPADGLDNAAIPNPIALVDKTTTYTVTVTDEKGCSATDKVTITIIEGVFIPNAFSPNGDGLNDAWEIIRISDYPNCRVEVYDRWGSTIFISSGYKIPWNGTFKGNLLPTGSYTYVIRLGDGGKAIRGSVAILR